jgi:hypothetical protein
MSLVNTWTENVCVQKEINICIKIQFELEDLDQTYFIPISDVCTEADMDMRSSPFWDITQH